jgi:imidazolonepropionase-like amidohydrolase
MLLGGAGLVTGGVPAHGQNIATATSAAVSVVFDDVTVVDVVHGTLLPQQRVVIAGTRIQAVGSPKTVKIPTGATVVDARGKYLIPGLWDMHAHSAGAKNVYPLLIANGITGIREMSSEWPSGFEQIRQRRREIASGTLVGPRIVATSNDFYSPVCTRPALEHLARMVYAQTVDAKSTPDSSQLNGVVAGMLNNAPCLTMNANTVKTPDEVRRMVDTLKAGGVDFVKAHAVSDRQVYLAFLSEAKRVGIPAAGHLTGPDGRAVTEIEASDSGIRSVEHINEVSCWQDERHANEASRKVVPWPDSIAEKQCAAVAAHFTRNGTWLVPTLYVFHYPVFGDVSDSAQYTHAVTLLHRAGTPMLAGTDAYTQSNVKEQMLESALHKELVLLVEAGFTPAEALRAATVNPAQFFDATDTLGTIAPGKVADCILLNANPLADIHNTRAIRAVVANGHYFDRAALDALIQKSRQ